MSGRGRGSHGEVLRGGEGRGRSSHGEVFRGVEGRGRGKQVGVPRRGRGGRGKQGGVLKEGRGRGGGGEERKESIRGVVFIGRRELK